MTTISQVAAAGPMISALLLTLPAHASTADCWPVSKQLASQVVQTPMNEGHLLVVVEDSVFDASGSAPTLAPTAVVPRELRRGMSPVELAIARSQDPDLVLLGPADFDPIVRAVVASVDGALERGAVARVETVGADARVLAGDSAFLATLVDVRPDVCPNLASQGWTVYTAQYCILDQIGGGVFAPRQMFPGWAGRIANQLTGDDIPLLDALNRLYTVNGVQPLAFFFLSEPGSPEGGPVRRVSFEVHYPMWPPEDSRPVGPSEEEEGEPDRRKKSPGSRAGRR